jgi:Flp pilus assembly protein TadG
MSDGVLKRSDNRWNFSALRGTDASAIVEFAVALPLLVVLVVGIFDFGAAFNLKQELNNAMREGARWGASEPTNDLDGATPSSVDSVRYLVDAYLLASNIPDCGLGTMSEPGNGAALTWVYSTTGTCGSALTLTIIRGCTSTTTPPCPNPPSTTMYLPTTYVQISYPYQWHFNSVIQLLVPGANFAPTPITTDAWATNMD